MTKKSNKYYFEKDLSFYLGTYKRFPIVLDHGEGVRVWDVEGNEYIDALAGIAVNILGHNHPAIVEAIRQQAGQLIHISNFYLSVPQVELSEKLKSLSGLERVFFTNSGAESVEGAFKIARKYAHSQGRGGEIISFEGCFHGRTLATIAAGKKSMQKGFGPMPTGFHQIPLNDMDAVRRATNRETSAIIIEPIQGEGGINVAEKSFMKELRNYCNEQNIVLIFDEIQCGIGRTGKMFAKDHFDIQPDIMTLAKALGGGVPVGAVLSNAKVSAAIRPGDHGTTFGGNPLACAAALAVLKSVENEDLIRQAEKKGQWLRDQLESLDSEDLKEVRGLGLMIGAVFNFETKPLVEEMLKRGVLVNATAGNVLRLVPPLNIDKSDLEKVIEVLKQSIKKLKEHA